MDSKHKPSFNVIITDLTSIEWLASRFIGTLYDKVRNDSNVRLPRTVYIEWIQKPDWSQRSSTPIGHVEYETSQCRLNIYSFPEAIRRDFQLSDLDIEWHGVVLIVDLGNHKLWDQLVDTGRIQLPIWDVPILNAIDEHVQAGHDENREIWGVSLVNQIKGIKLALGIRSHAENVPIEFVNQYLRLDTRIDILVQDADPSEWSKWNGGFPEVAIEQLLKVLEKKFIQKI